MKPDEEKSVEELREEIRQARLDLHKYKLENTFHGRTRPADEFVGRFQKADVASISVVGSSIDNAGIYPRSGVMSDISGDTPPTGECVDDQIPVGTEAEIQASLIRAHPNAPLLHSSFEGPPSRDHSTPGVIPTLLKRRV
jgi:hypothetical protein